ncbi:ESPR-type extended signal peptide-containing protein, partial [Variovorax sp. JS1663]
MHRHASLNRAYRLVFNQAQGTCVVAPETARSAGG